MRLILASKSQSRQDLLKNAGIAFSAQPVAIDERALQAKLKQATPQQTAIHLAEQKAIEASRINSTALIIGADQILDFADQILHKPQSRAEAKAQLLAFRGKAHTLYAACALAKNGEICASFCDSATMTMRNFSEQTCDKVLDQMGETYLHCVGAYTLEGPAVQLFEKIEGDYFTILGLPMLPLLVALRENGIN